MKLVFLAMIFIGLIVGCNNSSDKGSGGGGASNPVPSLAAIAKATLPATLESSAVSVFGKNIGIRTIDANLAEMQSRLFDDGPTDFLFRLKMVDSRLNEMASRLTSCSAAATQDATPPAIVTGFSFPMKLACVETIDATSQGVSDFKVYFGKDAGYWYLVEVQENASFSAGDAEPPSMAVLAKVSEDGNEMDVWQISVEHNGSTDYAGTMHITANKATGVFSLVTASDADMTQTLSPGANFSGLGCGVQMITDGTEVYANGRFSQNASCPSAANVCTLTDLSTASTCLALSISGDLLSLYSRSDVDGSQAKALIIDKTWLPTF